MTSSDTATNAELSALPGCNAPTIKVLRTEQTTGNKSAATSSSSINLKMLNLPLKILAKRPSFSKQISYDETLNRYYRAEDKLLADIEALVNNNQRPDSSDSCSPSKAPSRRFQTLEDTDNYLSTMCRVMNGFAQVRRENRRLKTQLCCAHEMRQIEALKNELWKKSCTCCNQLSTQASEPEALRSNELMLPQIQTEAPTMSDSAVTNTSENLAQDASTSYNGERAAQCQTMTLPDDQVLRAGNKANAAAVSHYDVPVGGVCRVASNSAPNGLLNADDVKQNVAEMKQSALPKPTHISRMPSRKTSKPEFLETSTPEQQTSARKMSDSDDQPVFSEVDLPEYPQILPAQHRWIRGSGSTSSKQTIASTQVSPYAAVNIGEHSSGSLPKQEKFWKRFHFSKREKHRLSAAESDSLTALGSSLKAVDERTTKVPTRDSFSASAHSESIYPWVSLSSFRKRSSSASLSEPGGENAGGAVSWLGGMRRALIKKRKRKISESDSMCSSSETSGKPYKIIDFNVAESDSVCHAPYIVTNHGKLEVQQQPRSKDSRLSTHGQLLQGGWLRKHKQQRMDNQSQNQELRKGRPNSRCDTALTATDRPQSYFAQSEESARQDTIIYLEPAVSHDLKKAPIPQERSSSANNYSISETNIRDLTDQPMTCLSSTNPSVSSINSQSKYASNLTASRIAILENLASKSRSVTFLEPAGGVTDSGRSPSLDVSRFTFSNDSVFTSREADLNKYGGNVLRHVISLQEKNSLLIRQLKDKSCEYERIAEQLYALEQEVQNVKERWRIEAEWEGLFSAFLLDANFAPMGLVRDLEKQISGLDDAIRVIKTDVYQNQQEASDNHSKEQAVNRRCLEEIERLQKSNLEFLYAQLNNLSLRDHDLKQRVEVMPSYAALYSFAMNLLRTLKQMRTKLFEKGMTISRLELEILQSQSALLLAHAQTERQKVEIRFLSTRKHLRRVHSYHGEDLLDRFINPEMSFYLPFKLHGTQVNRSHCQLEYTSEDLPEADFIRLFEGLKNLQLPATQSNTQLSPTGKGGLARSMPTVQQPIYESTNNVQSAIKTLTNSPILPTRRPRLPTPVTRQRPPPIYESIPVSIGGQTSQRGQRKPRPSSAILMPTVEDSSVKKLVNHFAEEKLINQETMTESITTTTSYIAKAPAPLRLGNVGQVRNLAAAFDYGDHTSAPNTPLTKNAPSLSHLSSKPKSPLSPRYRSPEKPAGTQESQLPKPKSSPTRPYPAVRPLAQVLPSTRQDQEVTSPVLRRKQQPAPSPIYETLTLSEREKSLTLPSQKSSGPSESPSPMAVSTDSTASSNWSISKLNELRRKQFFSSSAKSIEQQKKENSSGGPLPMASNSKNLGNKIATAMQASGSPKSVQKLPVKLVTTEVTAKETSSAIGGPKKRTSWLQQKLKPKK